MRYAPRVEIALTRWRVAAEMGLHTYAEAEADAALLAEALGPRSPDWATLGRLTDLGETPDGKLYGLVVVTGEFEVMDGLWTGREFPVSQTQARG